MRRARMIVALLAGAALVGCQGLDVRPGATSVFEALKPPPPKEAAEMATNTYDPDARYRGTLLLSTAYFAGEDAYLKLFEANAEDKDPGVRCSAIRALGLHGGPAHAAIIARSLADADVGVRTEAARALQRLHDPDVVPALLAAGDPSKEREPGVRIEAARALGQYAQPQVVERLIAALRDERLAVNDAARQSLSTLTGQDLGVDPGAWQRWYKATPNLFAARRAYVYPVFERPKRWFEYIPFVPGPPNEAAAMPAGLTAAEFADVPVPPAR